MMYGWIVYRFQVVYLNNLSFNTRANQKVDEKGAQLLVNIECYGYGIQES